MKYLVTVGTTSFDSLIKRIDELSRCYPELDVVSQIGPGNYVPKYHAAFRFSRGLFDNYSDRVVITHCGAGSVYTLLEKQKPFICVPNLERSDVHQKELASFVFRNHLAKVVWSCDEMDVDVLADPFSDIDIKPYVKDSFFKADEINNIIRR